MGILFNPYLGFRDETKRAMEFYRSVFGGDLQTSTFGEFQADASDDPDKIMHAQLTTDAGFTIMASDTPAGMEHSPGGPISLSLSGDDEATLRGWWDKLADGGTVTMPLDTAPWGDVFGMLTDRFGVAWMVSIAQG